MMIERFIIVGDKQIDIKISDVVIPDMKLSWTAHMVAGNVEPFKVESPDGTLLPGAAVQALLIGGMFKDLCNDPTYDPFTHTKLYIHTTVNK